MKKLVLLVLLAVFSMGAAFAQAYEKGSNLLNVGIGLGGGFGTPIGISFEHGFSDKISAGAYVGYGSKTESLGGWGDWKMTYGLAAARASYHFDLGVEKLDTYIGAILGYNYVDSKWNGAGAIPAASASASKMIYGGHAGARYFVSDKIAIFGEVGYGIANLNAGVAFKF